MRSVRATGTRTPLRPGRPRARAIHAVAALAALALLGPARGLRAEEGVVLVRLDRAQVMRYPADTETVIVGNPIIADVTMLRNSGELILTGRGYGDTNLLFLDAKGTVLSEARLRVREASSMVVVQRGPERETYACEPRCQPTVTLGDSSAYMAESAKAVQLRNGLASGAASGAGGGPK